MASVIQTKRFKYLASLLQVNKHYKQVKVFFKYLYSKSSQLMYCLKCKSDTPNSGKEIIKTTSTGRKQLKAVCAVCGTNKSKFLPNPIKKLKQKN